MLGRIAPAARELGCEAALAPLGGWEGGAARQRAAVVRGERLPAFLAATTT